MTYVRSKCIVYWSRRDFRLRDNRALGNAIRASKETGTPFLPVFLIEPYMTRGRPDSQFGYPSRYFVSRAVPAFAEKFESFLVVHEKPVSFFLRLLGEYDLEIYVNEDVHPDFYTQIRALRDAGISIKLFRDQLTVLKDTVTGSGGRYSIFTPFKNAVWRSFANEQEDRAVTLRGVRFFDTKKVAGHIHPIPPEKLQSLFSENESITVGYESDRETFSIAKLGLPERDLSKWYVSEDEALRHARHYIANHITAYRSARDQLADDATSKLSLALTWGLVSARTLVHLVRESCGERFENPNSQLTSHQGPIHFISELIWREFYKYLFFHDPHLFTQPFQKKYAHITWVAHEHAVERFTLWMQGRTGYPIVDAAMMQLARTGWMHNRARMIVASVLTKNLGVDWRWGQEYFRAMLIDLDESSNNGGWQWAASVGADPKPIRIFNPYLQAENYDKDTMYQDRWLSDEYKKNPPPVIVEHSVARGEALKRYGLEPVHNLAEPI